METHFISLLFILYLNGDFAELLNLDLFIWKSEKFHRSRIKFQRTVLSEFYVIKVGTGINFYYYTDHNWKFDSPFFTATVRRNI